MSAVAKLCDPVQTALGDFGWWQFWITFALSLLKFPIAWHQLAIIFLGARTPFQCDVDNKTTLLNVTDVNQCSSRDPAIPCQKFIYDRSIFTETIITEVSIHLFSLHINNIIYWRAYVCVIFLGTSRYLLFNLCIAIFQDQTVATIFWSRLSFTVFVLIVFVFFDFMKYFSGTWYVADFNWPTLHNQYLC